MKFKNPYDRQVSAGIINDEPSMTQQHFEHECNINNIMCRYMKTGILPDPLSSSSPTYADVSDFPSFEEAQNKLCRVKECFEGLPSEQRRQFGDNVNNFVQFMSDTNNLEKAHQMGIIDLSVIEEFKNGQVDKDFTNSSEGMQVPSEINGSITEKGEVKQ